MLQHLDLYNSGTYRCISGSQFAVLGEGDASIAAFSDGLGRAFSARGCSQVMLTPAHFATLNCSDDEEIELNSLCWVAKKY